MTELTEAQEKEKEIIKKIIIFEISIF